MVASDNWIARNGQNNRGKIGMLDIHCFLVDFGGFTTKSKFGVFLFRMNMLKYVYLEDHPS